jgi:hypothetical protein
MKTPKASTQPAVPSVTVPILDTTAWREFRGVPASAGVNPTTHLAKIADPTDNLRDCFVKLLPEGPGLLCETLGWLLARACGAPSAAFGAIVIVPLAELRKSATLPPWLDDAAYWPAWCSEVVSGKSLRQIHKWAFFIAKKNLFRSHDGSKIAAFDKWTDLRDRNFGNVIRSPKGGYVAIDHETLLHDLLWEPFGITWEERCLTVEASKALSDTDFKRFQVDMANAAKGHAAALATVQSELDAMIAKIVTVPAASAHLRRTIASALAQRSQPDWMTNYLQVIA